MPLLFMGDQLTVERARSCKEARVNSSSSEDALLGLEPAICDWHAEANFVQVCQSYCNTTHEARSEE